MRRRFGFAMLFAGAAFAVTATAGEIAIRTYRSDDTLLRIGPYAFEGGKTLNLYGRHRQQRVPPRRRPAQRHLDAGRPRPQHRMQGHEGGGRRRARLPRDQEQPRLSDAVLRAVDLSRDAARRRHVPRHRRHHAEGSRRPPAQRHAACRCAPRPPRRRSTAAASGWSRSLRGIDAEGLVRLSDGSFWVGEENAPSLAHFSADGRMIERHVPAGTETEFAGAPYETIGSLPAIIAKRQANRGIEGIAISPDERFLYFIMQSPLANPDTADVPAGPQHAAVQARPRDHEGGRRIRLHARRSAKLPPRSVAQAERSAHQRTDGDRPRPADRAGAHRTDHQALRDRTCRRDQHRGQPLGRRGDAADAGADRPGRGGDRRR